MNKQLKDLMAKTTIDSIRFHFDHNLNIEHEDLLTTIEALYPLTRVVKDGYHLKEGYSSKSIKQLWSYNLKDTATIKITVYKSHPYKTHFEIYSISQYRTNMQHLNNLEDAYQFIEFIFNMSKTGLKIKSIDVSYDLQKEFPKDVLLTPLLDHFSTKNIEDFEIYFNSNGQYTGFKIETTKQTLCLYDKQFKDGLDHPLIRVELTQREEKWKTINKHRKNCKGVMVDSITDINSYSQLIKSELCTDIIPILDL